MDFAAFQSLGEQVQQRYLGANYDEQKFPTIAERALQDWQPGLQFSVDALIEFLLTTSIPQQPENEFSNLPIIVYRSRHFFIECLFWADATTAIHQHAFCGAFKILLGSSLHTTYRFAEQSRVSRLLLIGDMLADTPVYLSTGSIYPISAGVGGLTHALYHLDQPTVTLVVRTYSEPWLQPQYELFPPQVATASQVLEKAPEVQLAERMLHLLLSLDNNTELLRKWCRQVVKLDFPCLFTISMAAYRPLQQCQLWDYLAEIGTERYPAWWGYLTDCLQEKKRIQSLIECRTSIVDADLRYFLALLLNVKTRVELLALVQQRFPDQPPVEQCVAWLTQLSDRQRLLNKDIGRHLKSSQKIAVAGLVRALTYQMNKISADHAGLLWNSLLLGETEQQFSIRWSDILTDQQLQQACSSYTELRKLPELSTIVH